MISSGHQSRAASIQRHFKLGELRPTNERTLIAIENVTTPRIKKGLARAVELDVEAAIPKLTLWGKGSNEVLLNQTVRYLMADLLNMSGARLTGVSHQTYRTIEKPVSHFLSQVGRVATRGTL